MPEKEWPVSRSKATDCRCKGSSNKEGVLTLSDIAEREKMRIDKTNANWKVSGHSVRAVLLK